MKLTRTILSIFLLCIFVKTEASSLEDDFQDFLVLFPESDIHKILQDYVNFDPQFRHLVNYIKTDTFQEMVQNAIETPEFLKLKEYLRSAGLDLDNVFDYVKKEIAHLEPQNGLRPETFDFKDFAADVKELMLYNGKLEELYSEKLENSEAFKVFIAKMKSEDMRSLVEKARHVDNVEKVVNRLEELKIDVTGFIQWLFVGLEWSLPKIYFY